MTRLAWCRLVVRVVRVAVHAHSRRGQVLVEVYCFSVVQYDVKVWLHPVVWEVEPITPSHADRSC
jgi:hypothetical protein